LHGKVDTEKKLTFHVAVSGLKCQFRGKKIFFNVAVSLIRCQLVGN